jgi:hypothetical protein
MIRKTELSQWLGAALLFAACNNSANPTAPRELSFGPFALQPGQELTDLCVSVTLKNDEPIYVNSVELSSGPGVHHSNWFWVPEHVYPGSDGAWSCAERGYNEAIAGLKGGVLFAMSTQATHEIQAFPNNAVIKIPPRSRIVAGVHLLDATDEPLSVPLDLTLFPIAEVDVSVVLAGLSFENQSIAIPPNQTSRFTLECDLSKRHQDLFGRPVDFKIYYVLPHYHGLGTELTFEALRDSDGGADMVWKTTQRTGDNLGGPRDPLFDMTGHSKIRFSCTFENRRAATVGWGVGDQEMCIIVAYTDSTYTWAGGITSPEDPGPAVNNGGIFDFTGSACSVFTADASH